MRDHWRNSSHTVIDAAVIYERRVQRMRQRETPDEPALRVMDRRDTLRDVLAFHEHHQHPVDTIPMQTFWRRLTVLARARLDAKLVTLGVP